LAKLLPQKPEQREISMTTMGIEFLPSIMTGRRGMRSGGNKNYVSGQRSCKKQFS
jgi:hypothetical protein